MSWCFYKPHTYKQNIRTLTSIQQELPSCFPPENFQNTPVNDSDVSPWLCGSSPWPLPWAWKWSLASVEQPTGGTEGPGPHQNEVKIWPIIVCKATRDTRTFIAHLFTLNGLKQTQNNSPVCYSLCRDQKPFNRKVGIGAVFNSKCIRNCLTVGLCPDPLWVYNAPS